MTPITSLSRIVGYPDKWSFGLEAEFPGLSVALGRGPSGRKREGQTNPNESTSLED